MAVAARGKIAQIYSDGVGCYVRLKDPVPDPAPKDGYFQLKLLAHENYQSVYALILAAAANGWTIRLRVKEEIVATEVAIINYAVVEF